MPTITVSICVRMLNVHCEGNSTRLSKGDNSLSKGDITGTALVDVCELLRRAAKVSFEVAAKVWLAGVPQGRSDLFVGKALGQERRREAHSLAHEPRLGRRVELHAEMPFQRTHVHPHMHRQPLHAEAI